MRKIISIAAFMLLAFTALAQDGRSIYRKYSDADGVSAVYISPAMFRMMGKIPDMDIEGSNINLGGIINTLSGLYIINCTNEIIISALRADVGKFVAGGKYEMLMEAKEDGETVRIYTVGDDRTVTGFLMLAGEPGECTFICIDGQMPREGLESILAGNQD